jgi:LPS export ABC transporter protein LptC
MSSYRNWVFGALAVLVVGGGLAIWNAEKNASRLPSVPQKPLTETGKSGQMVGRGVSFIVTEGELKKWKLTAGRAVYNPEHTDAVLSDVKGEFYNAKGEPVMAFSSKDGNYVNKDHAVTLTGNVVAKSIDGATQSPGSRKGELQAPRMLWDSKTDWMTATGGVTMYFPQGKSVAQSCRFNLDFSKIALHGGVMSTIQP